MHPSGRLAVSIGKEPGVPLWKVWDLQTGKSAACEKSPFGAGLLVHSLAWHSSGEWLLAWGDRIVAVFGARDLQKPVWRHELTDRLAPKILSAAFLGGDRVIFGGNGSVICIADFMNAKILEQVDLGLKPRIKAIGVGENAIVLATSSGLLTAYSLDLKTRIAEVNCEMRVTCMVISEYSAK